MLAWALYMMLIAVLFGAAALVAERAARLRLITTRWFWLAAIAGSLLGPLAMGLPRAGRPAIPPSAVPARSVAPGSVAAEHLTGVHWIVWQEAVPPLASRALDSTLRICWIAASGTLALALCGASACLAWRQRRWIQTRIGGVPVYMAPDVGPAVVGLLWPRVVVPSWLSELPAAQQSTVVAHEQSHLDAGDPGLVALALCALVCAPWNLPLWWQLRRLRRAIEVDCDARVLRSGGDPIRYGDTLLAVGRRQSLSVISVAAMSESTSFIEERITLMLRRPAKSSTLAVAALGAASLSLVAMAAQVTPPPAPAPAQASGAAGSQAVLVHLPTSVLDGYAGVYAYGHGYNAQTVRREGDHLTIASCGERSPQPLYPQSTTLFFYEQLQDNGAGISFVPGKDGVATAAVMHQNGASTPMPRIDAATGDKLCAALTARMQSKTFAPGAEAMLKRLLSGIAAGKPPLEEMNPQIAAAIRSDLPKLQVSLERLGAVQKVSFVRVNGGDMNMFKVVGEHGSSEWGVALDSGGTLVGVAANLTPD
jgi:bla regulator protein blaR1